jgi:hypothetical protein
MLFDGRALRYTGRMKSRKSWRKKWVLKPPNVTEFFGMAVLRESACDAKSRQTAWMFSLSRSFQN